MTDTKPVSPKERLTRLIDPDLTIPAELGIEPLKDGMFLEIDEDISECHCCGEFLKNNYHINLQNLCQHFVSLCPVCLLKLLLKLGITKRFRWRLEKLKKDNCDEKDSECRINGCLTSFPDSKDGENYCNMCSKINELLRELEEVKK